MKTIKLAMIGYGNVGQAFGRMLERKKEFLKEEYGVDVVISAICTRGLGVVIDANGISELKISELKGDKSLTAMDVIEKAEYDVMVELTPVNIMTGQPATGHIETALSRGKHVITANKGPIAWNYRRLRDLAKDKGVRLLYEGTVMDGIPVYNLAQKTLKGCNVIEVKGIFNATTNFILEQLEEGVSYDDAIADGKKRGFVEADPSLDIDGWDASAKLTALMNVVMDLDITPMEIEREGIGNITKEDLLKAKENGKTIKLICHGKVVDGKPVGIVKPTLVDKDDLYATIKGVASVVTFNTDLFGEVSIVEHPFKPEIDQTAYAILSDLIEIIETA